VVSGTLTARDPNLYSQIMVVVTDATGASIKRPYSIKTIYPTFPVSPSVLPAGQIGAAYAQTLTASGGTAPYRFIPIKSACPKVSALLPPPPCNLFVVVDTQDGMPAGLRMDSSGRIPGTPTGPARTTTIEFLVMDAGYTGPITTNLLATLQDSIRQVQITIDQKGLALSATLPDGVSGLPYQQGITATGGVAPYRFELLGGALPPGLTLAQDGTLRGTSKTAGTYGFTVGATDSGTPGRTGAQAFSITIARPAVIAPRHAANTLSGAPVRIVLTEGASGGPFTGASIVSMDPADAGTAAIEMVSAGASPGYALVFTSSATFAGVVELRYTLQSAQGASLPESVLITVVPRPDPANDADVRGLSNAQVDAARRFASGQTVNVSRRLERLHDARSRQAVEGAVGVILPMSCTGQTDTAVVAGCGAASNGMLTLGAVPHADAAQGDLDGWSLWIAGTLRGGEQDGRDGLASTSTPAA
jgi:hypothetical protein